jgi:hypothetical protein
MSFFLITITTDDPVDKETILSLLSEAEDNGEIEGPFNVKVDEVDDEQIN